MPICQCADADAHEMLPALKDSKLKIELFSSGKFILRRERIVPEELIVLQKNIQSSIFNLVFLPKLYVMQHPPVSLENLSEQEKIVLVEDARKGIVRGIFFFLIPFGIFGFLMFYVNNHYMGLGLDKQENLRATINVLLVVLTILPARLFVNTVLRFRKANNAWQKKVFRGTVTNKEGRTIFIGHHKVKVTAQQAAPVNNGDEVMISIASAGDYPLGVEIVKKEE